MRTVVACLLAVLLVVWAAHEGLRVLRADRGGRGVEPLRPPEARADVPGEIEVPAGPLSAGGRRPSNPLAETSAPAKEERSEIMPPPRVVRVRGRVLSPEGAPLAGLRVAFAPQENAGALTSPDGSFLLTLEGPAKRGSLNLLDAEWALVRGSDVDLDREPIEHLLIAAPAVHVEGTVVDVSLRGVGGVKVVVDLPPGALARIPVPLDSTTVRTPFVETDERGRFVFDRLPAIEGTCLQARHPAHPQVRVRLPSHDCYDLLIELRLPEDGPRVLGTVLYPTGEPAPDALVSFAGRSTRTDEWGRFALSPGWIPEDADLVAVARGYQPGVLRDCASLVRGSPTPTSFVVVLGAAALHVSGRVQRADGSPAAGLRVAICAGQDLAPGSMPPRWAEDFAAGREGPATTAQDGSFEIGGLREGTYTLQAWSETTLEIVRSPPVPAGTEDILLTLPSDPHVANVTGRVVFAGGEPCPGAEVAVELVYVETEYGSDWIEGARSVTDAGGGFVLASVPRTHARLSVTGNDLIPVRRGLSPEDLRGPLIIPVERRCYFRVESQGGEPAPDGFQLLNEQGEPVSFYSFASQQWVRSSYGSLSGGRSVVLSQAPGHYALRFLRSGQEVARREFDLHPPRSPDEVTVVRAPLD